MKLKISLNAAKPNKLFYFMSEANKSKKFPLEISLDNAKPNKLFYFVATSVIYHPRLKKCLILQRSRTEKVHPLVWGVTGGKMEWEDLLANKITRMNIDVPNWEGLVETLVKREAKEESGLVVGDLHYLEDVVFLRPDKVPVVCIKFAAKYKSGKVKMAPEFEDYAWVNERELKKFHHMDGIDREVKRTMAIFQR